jgi:predicted dehydrogenase
MKNDWGIVGCAYMSREYCKVLTSRGITPRVYSRNLASPNVKSFQDNFPQLKVKEFAEISNAVNKWIVCTNIESHEEVCSKLEGRIYCEKPFSHVSTYDASKDISILMNRRYYYWVNYIRDIIDSGKIVKVVACIPEKSIDALITQSIHVIDLLWYLTGAFQSATKVGSTSPTFILSTDKDIPLVINMNYGSHENFSLRFYGDDGVIYEAKPLESFSITEGMEVREPDDDIPVRTYRPISHPLLYTPTSHKPGLDELVDDLIQNSPTRLPTLLEHRDVHAWMEGNML